MKSFQKFLITCAVSSFFAMNFNQAYALTLSDVPAGYWAEGAIIETVENNYLPVKGDKFYPNAPVSRAEFANAVYSLLHRTQSGSPKGFKDVTYKTPYGNSILSLQQLRVVFGYPDGNFKPESAMKRSEASSVVANIVRSEEWDDEVLNRFKDKNEIPYWATPSYVSNTINDIYVNYPKDEYLQPNEYITKAETAVLVTKLKYAIENYKTSFLPNLKNGENANSSKEDRYVPVYVGTNTLSEFKYPYNNRVDLYDTRKIILAGNIVPVRSLQKVNSKTVQEGEILTYVSPKDVYSNEGNKLYSQGTKFIAMVEKVQKSYWLKKQDKAYIVFNKAVLNDGTEFPVAGVLYAMYNGDVVLEKKQNTRKVEKDAKKQYRKQDAAINYANKKLTPVIKYNEKAQDNLFMLITGDMIIPEANGL